MQDLSFSIYFFFFNDTATTEIYTLSLHDALPISGHHLPQGFRVVVEPPHQGGVDAEGDAGRRQQRLHPLKVPPAPVRQALDRKSTRLNSSHANISYAVFCLKKKNKIITKLRLLHD